MGLTKQQLAQRKYEDSRRTKQYFSTMKDRWDKLEAEWLERAKTMEMLLDARYFRKENYFIKEIGDGDAYVYFDCKGKQITKNETFEQSLRRPW